MKKIILFVSTIIMLFCIYPIIVMATGEASDLDFSDATGNEMGEGWIWDNNSKVLTLSGVNFTEGIILPSDSSIEIEDNTINIIQTSNTVPITTSGNLTIEGNGKLSLITDVSDSGVGLDTLSGVTNLFIKDVNLYTSGVTGLLAENVSIVNSIVDIYGYKYGIQAASSKADTDVTVEMINCSGTITGKTFQGIDVVNRVSGNVKLDIQNCYDLIISGNITNTRLSSEFDRSGVRLLTLGSKSDATVTIKESDGVYFYGTNTGIAIDVHSNDSSTLQDNGKASLIIDDSRVVAETVTKTWAAFFVNNNGVGKDASCEITINDSHVSALAPNDVAIMTSTKNAGSSVTVRNSVVELEGLYAGIRAKSNTSSDAEIYVIENSLIVVVGKVSTNYKALDEMDKAVSSDGITGVDQDSKVLSPKDCEIVLKSDGNWDIPDGGTVLINGVESSFLYGGIIELDGDVLPYVTSLNDSEFTDLNGALSLAEIGDNVILLITDGTEEAILPFGVTLTSSQSIKVDTDEYGYKVIEEVYDGKYIYSVVPLDVFTVTYHSNYDDNKIIVRNAFEQMDYKLESNFFEAPDDMEFDFWIIDDNKYSPGDVYYITNNIDVYASWKVKEYFYVTFDANGGIYSDKKNIISIKDWDIKDYDKLEKPTRSGYEFLGYYTHEKDGISLKEYLTEYDINDDITFYAQWKIKEENPKTFDNIKNSIFIGCISFISLVGVSIYLLRKNNKMNVHLK